MRVVKSSYRVLLWIQVTIIFTCIHFSSFAEQAHEINPHLQKIVSSIASLPEDSQPTNIKRSLALMLEGGQVYRAVMTNKFYNALTLPALSGEATSIVEKALSLSDDKFWILIHKDPLVQQAIEHCNLDFTRDVCMKNEYKMLFRITYLRTHITDPETVTRIQLAFEHAVIALQWFLFGQAILQDSVFISGMITIPDSNHNLFHFLDAYAELVSPRYKFYSGLHPHSLWQSSAYTRSSNYWHGKKLFNDSMFAIDFQTPEGIQAKVLPGNNAHLMFCALDSGMTAIKWEQFGTTLNIKNRNFSALKHPLKYLQKTDKNEAGMHRKDKVPHDVTLQFKSLFGGHTDKHQVSKISRDGISAMLHLLDEDGKKLFAEFLTKRKKYSALTLPLRKGDEIVLQPKNFKNLSVVKKIV